MVQHPVLLATGAIIMVVLLVGGGPFAGWYILRRNRLLNLTAVPEGQPWIETRELPKLGSARYLRSVPPPVWNVPNWPTRELHTPTAPLQAPSVDEETQELEPAYSTQGLPDWAGESTQAWSLIEAEVYTSELAEVVGETGLTDAEQAWLADPLASVCLPPEPLEEHGTPLAHQAFDILVAMNALSGEGADLDTEWEAWNLYEKQESYA